jgi:predicted RNase H-like HicB family nuclease
MAAGAEFDNEMRRCVGNTERPAEILAESNAGGNGMRLEVKIAREVCGDYRAWCPALPGCAVRAESDVKARKDIAEAIAGYVASLNGSHHFVIVCQDPPAEA